MGLISFESEYKQRLKKKRKGKEGIVINLMLNKSFSLLEPCTSAEFVLISVDGQCFSWYKRGVL